MDRKDAEPGSPDQLFRVLAVTVLKGVDAFPKGATREDLVRYLRGDTPGDPGEPPGREGARGRLWFSKKKPLENLIEILFSQGLLGHGDASSGEPRLRVTEEGHAFLEDPGTEALAPGGFHQGADPEGVSPLDEEESKRFERLRSFRNERARDADVPPYIVCNNEVLKALARRRPATLPEIAAIRGVGPSFLEDHADAFLQKINEDGQGGPPSPPTSGDEEDRPADDPAGDKAAPSGSGRNVGDDRRGRDPPRESARPGPPSREEALEALSSVFGHDAFLPGQWPVIERILAGESAIAIFPTGGGKSLCYQLPAVVRDETTLVVSPLKALMKDQVDALQERGVAAAREDSSTSFQESQDTLASFADGSLDILYVAPERFNNDRFIEALSDAEIDVLAIDEAHCISEWGHSFRPDYLKLARYADEWEIPQVVGLTATATERVARDMCDSFDIPEDNVVRLPSHRENLDLQVEPVSPDERYDALVSTLREDPVGPTIVYAKRRKTTEQVAELLAEDGFPAKAFHAGLDDDEKHDIQDWFMDSSEGIIVATIAFGMGVDKPDIRRVVHYNMPSSLESYAQQVGRAGRDGKRSRCTFLYRPDDVNLSTNYEWGSTPSRDQFEAVLERIFASGAEDRATGEGELPTLDLLAYEKEVGVRRTKVQTLVALLENEGFLQQHTPVNATFRYRLLEPEDAVADGLSGEDRALFRTVQAQADHKQRWSHLHIPSFVEETGVPRTRLGDLLDTLPRQGAAHVTARDYVYPYEVLAKPDDLATMAARFQETFQGLEDRAVERVRDVPRRLSEARCIWTAIAGHFGETMDGPCGHCSTCEDGEPPDLPLPEPKPIPDEAGEHLAEALEQAPGLAEEPMTLAEFLCGRYSVGVRSHGLHSLDGYRCLEYHALEDVLGWVGGEVG